jgi:predicted RNase H-like nuclease
MAVILGIDAAWTERGSSAIALLRSSGRDRHIVAVSPSYSSFLARADGLPVGWKKPVGGAPDVAQLLKASQHLAGAPVDVVAIDMPMSARAITGYRTADRKLSSAFGAVQVSTHTPNGQRPGSHGERITQDFVRAGFYLATIQTQKTPPLVEVFPLAAIVRLMSLTKRPPYKTTKTSRYWPGVPLSERMALLLNQWQQIESAIRMEVGELGFELPAICSSMNSLKPYEDALDAVICAWTGLCFHEGAAEPFGDDEAAIWVPRGRHSDRSRPPGEIVRA